MHERRKIYLTFGQWGLQAVLDISNIRPLKFCWERLTLEVCPHILETSCILLTLKERGAEDFMFIYVGGAKMRNAMLHGYRACRVKNVRDTHSRF